jgi:hypothetical protein
MNRTILIILALFAGAAQAASDFKDPNPLEGAWTLVRQYCPEGQTSNYPDPASSGYALNLNLSDGKVIFYNQVIDDAGNSCEMKAEGHYVVSGSSLILQNLKASDNATQEQCPEADGILGILQAFIKTLPTQSQIVDNQGPRQLQMKLVDDPIACSKKGEMVMVFEHVGT